MATAKPLPSKGDQRRARSYRAITRHSDGRIIHVLEFEATNDREALAIVTASGSDFRMDLWNSEGLVRRFGLVSG